MIPQEEEEDDPQQQQRRVSWGQVYVREHVRRVGGSLGVPLEGTWTLGLDFEIRDTYSPGSIDAFERQRQVELRARLDKIRKRSKSNPDRDTRELETRQYDYTARHVNVCFTRQSERQRKCLLLGQALENHEKHEMTVMAMHQLGELETLRHSREHHVGCACGNDLLQLHKRSVKTLRKLVTTYLGVGKEAGQTKPDLIQMLQHVAKSFHPCGDLNSCECVTHGIPCHERVCGAACRHPSTTMSSCANPVPMCRYDESEIRHHRHVQLERVAQQQQQQVADWTTRQPTKQKDTMKNFTSLRSSRNSVRTT